MHTDQTTISTTSAPARQPVYPSFVMPEHLRRVPGRVTPPYDTGKVQIGLLYIPRQRELPDADMNRLQTVLLASAPGPRSLPHDTPFAAVVARIRNIVRALS